jgi:hypothetical protein
MSVTLTRHWSDDAEWFVREGGHHLGSILWLSHPMLWRALAHDRRPVRHFEDMNDAITWLENA